MAPAETPAAFLRIAHRDLRAARAMLFQMLRDQGAAIEPFRALSRFTLFAVLRRYDEEPDLEQLDRDTWNQRCAELLDHVASLIP
ncbi:MAG: hypothetical protein VKO65_02685 [Cyanobacteriota bacterium]|nr:hypothetical protein [Cyanobacteriota bacterium]